MNDVRGWVAALPRVCDERQWRLALDAVGLACPQWPADVGGRGLDPAQTLELAAELERTGRPPLPAGLGETLVGPLIVAAGEAGRRDSSLHRIRCGTERYCLAFTEPGAGSDLWRVDTVAVHSGRSLLLTGDKSWVRGAADRALVLCRSAAGLTLALVDLDQPGVHRTAVVGASARVDGYTLSLRAARAEPLGPPGRGREILAAARPALAPILARRGILATAGAAALADLATKVGRERERVTRLSVAAVHAGVAGLRAHHRRMVAAGRIDDLAALATERALYAAHRRALADAALELLGAEALVTGGGPLTGWHRLAVQARQAEVVGGAEQAVRDAVAAGVLGLPGDGQGATPGWRALVEEAAADTDLTWEGAW